MLPSIEPNDLKVEGITSNQETTWEQVNVKWFLSVFHVKGNLTMNLRLNKNQWQREKLQISASSYNQEHSNMLKSILHLWNPFRYIQ